MSYSKNRKGLMIPPNYKDGCIVNLMSSISKALGYNAMYKPLKLLPPGELSAKNIVLLVIDGLGYEFLKSNGKKGILWKNNLGRISTVFPPTTASAITSFRTGLAPQQHAITGWFVYMKELGMVIKPLRMSARSGCSITNIEPGSILTSKPLCNKIKVLSYEVSPKDIIDSDYTISMAGRSKRISYTTMAGLFRKLRQTINLHNRRKYIYGYWPGLDSLCHAYGTRHRKVKLHFKELQDRIKSFLRSIEGTDTIVLITGDHGLINTTRAETIDLDQHPLLQKALTLPLSGEPRTAYCYVHPSMERKFKSYINKHFSDKCWLFKSEELIKKGYFGLHKPSRKLPGRIGDYVLITKGNHIIRDTVLGEKRHSPIGHHGGVSRDEMYVPLIVFGSHSD